MITSIMPGHGLAKTIDELRNDAEAECKLILKSGDQSALFSFRIRYWYVATDCSTLNRKFTEQPEGDPDKGNRTASENTQASSVDVVSITSGPGGESTFNGLPGGNGGPISFTVTGGAGGRGGAGFTQGPGGLPGATGSMGVPGPSGTFGGAGGAGGTGTFGGFGGFGGNPN